MSGRAVDWQRIASLRQECISEITSIAKIRLAANPEWQVERIEEILDRFAERERTEVTPKSVTS